MNRNSIYSVFRTLSPFDEVVSHRIKARETISALASRDAYWKEVLIQSAAFVGDELVELNWTDYNNTGGLF